VKQRTISKTTRAAEGQPWVYPLIIKGEVIDLIHGSMAVLHVALSHAPLIQLACLNIGEGYSHMALGAWLTHLLILEAIQVLLCVNKMLSCVMYVFTFRRGKDTYLVIFFRFYSE
jgi:hypothetical protein